MLEEQMALRKQCRHPSNEVAEISLAELDGSVPARFAKMVTAYPERVAIWEETNVLTYAALDRVSNRIARAIQSLDQQHDEPIVLLMDVGCARLAVDLGISKAGNCSVGLPVETPIDRLKFMVEDSGAVLLVTDRHCHELASALAGNGIALRLVEDLMAADDDGPVTAEIGPDSLYHITYTSGSTGRPKGVVRTHGDALHDARATLQSLQLCRHDRLAAFNYNNYFPASNTVLAGAAYYELHLLRNGVPAVLEAMAEQEVTVLTSTVTTFRQIVRSAAGTCSFPALRCVRLLGEPPTPADILAAPPAFPAACVYSNHYGSIESHIIATYYMDAATAARHTEFPPGYAKEGMEILLLDEEGQPVAQGEEGEIAARSRFLSQGYWNRPQLTRERFLSTDDESRIYLTGDLGWRDEHGCLYYRGRRDQQVKIRSHRVQIPEVEEVLSNVAGVAAVAVTARPGPNGDLRLVAYVVPTLPGLTVSEIRQAAGEHLPPFMLPATFVFLDALPLTTTSKIDRLALPDPETIRPPLAVAYAPPRTPIEARLAQIWAEVLGLDRVGLHDNFLDLGGNSLLASQIVTRVVSGMNVTVPISHLFSLPTVADMALAIVESMFGADGSDGHSDS